MKHWKNFLISTSLIMVGGSLVTPIISVKASESNISMEENLLESSFDPNFNSSKDELIELGLSFEEAEEFNDYQMSNINVIDGIAYIDGHEIISMERGKLTWAVKAIRKVYNKLPTKVKSVIATYTGSNGFLNLVEHYTGSLENAIYNACKKVGMSNTNANLVTKTIMLFIW